MTNADRLREIADAMDEFGFGRGDHNDGPHVRDAADEIDRMRRTIDAAWAAAQAGNLPCHAAPEPGNDATVSLAGVMAGVAVELKRRGGLYLDEFKRCTKLIESVTAIGEQCDRLIAKNHALMDALLPFARQADCFVPPDGEPAIDDAEHFHFRGSYAAITAGDCRRAAAVLTEQATSAGKSPVSAERDRLRAGLEMLSQVRHVSGSAQGAFRSNLRVVDAVLAGADVRDLATVEAIAAGTWKPLKEPS